MEPPFLSKPIQNPKETPYLDWIKSEEKEFEGRLQTKIGEWGLKKGLRIKFYNQENPDSWVLIEVTDLPTFPDFGAAFDVLGSKLIPGKTREQVVALYNGLFHDPDEDVETLNRKSEPSRMIQRHGVVAIGMKVITMRPI
ncbi:PUA-like superfamily [Fadolivirus algeromassiliense]|jgi:ASC-1-like (ASCH) protein|uniref:PUA-like superfamily n=1 Tax=Fadolivirus FV1/VV64 TaxID=3070911 RepID=A0A7D3V9B4_9VIRU|nr:PUA-like superfamily [Fadolivirus algeromassiliense]QKF94837.1 PUA-like superfamily [Fadolivirus FV1/VV64]